MTKERWIISVFLVMVAVDVVCLAIGEPQSWLAGFGARGVVLDFVIGIVLLFRYVKEG